MTLQLKALLFSCQGSQHTHTVAPNCHSSLRGSATFFWSPQALHACGTLTHIQANHSDTKIKGKP